MVDMKHSERVLFLDIDNCLYSPDLGISQMMKSRIYAYGREIGLDSDEVEETCSTYFKDYGLTVRGLVLHHNIDPQEFNDKVDGSLPLEDIIKPNPLLRNMIESANARIWAFTNAGLDHASRVLKCLGIEDLFEGITYCDYTEPNFPCKPEKRVYEKAMKEAGVSNPQLCYFADDSAKNVEAALQLDWTAVHVSKQTSSCEHGYIAGEDNIIRCCHIETVLNLPQALPELFS